MRETNCEVIMVDSYAAGMLYGSLQSLVQSSAISILPQLAPKTASLLEALLTNYAGKQVQLASVQSILETGMFELDQLQEALKGLPQQDFADATNEVSSLRLKKLKGLEETLKHFAEGM